MSYDISEFITWITDTFEPQMRIDGRKGQYARSVGETEMELYGISDMACVLYTIGALNPSADELVHWRNGFHSLQDPETGYILERDPSHSKFHNTAFALGAMNLLCLKPEHPLHCVVERGTRETLTAFMDDLD